MAVLLTRIEWSPTGSGSSEPVVFTDVETTDLSKNSDASASKGTITLKNALSYFRDGFSTPFSKYVSTANEINFNEGDTIKIYAKYLTDSYSEIDTSVGSPDLLMSGEIAEVTTKGSAKDAKVKLQIVDKTYVILNQLHTRAYTSTDSVNSPEIIKDVVRNVTDDVDSDDFSYDDSGNLVENGIYAVDARLVSEGGFIEDTRINSSLFPDLAMAKVAKAAYDWIKDLSTTDSTNDYEGSDDPDAPTQNRNMLFYIDELNRFHWYYPRDKATGTLNGAINDSVTTITLNDASSFPSSGSVFIDSERIDYTGKSSNDLTGCTRGANNTTAASHSDGATVSTAITLIEGDTSTGDTVLNFNLTKKTFDVVNFVVFNTGGDLYGNGITSYFFDRATKSKTLKQTYKPYTEISRDLIEDEIQAGNLIQDNTQNDFTYKGNFYKANTYGFTTKWGVDTTGFSNDDYNDALRDQAILLGSRKAQALTKKRGSPRWKGNIELKFKRYTAGELLEFTSTRAGINQQSLRITNVKYNLSNTGGFVTLTVEEDEAKLGE